MSRTMRKYRQGQVDYMLMKPRRRYEESAGRPTPDGLRHLGWMVARGREVMRIIDELRSVGADQTRGYDVILSRRVRDIDRKHGFGALSFTVV